MRHTSLQYTYFFGGPILHTAILHLPEVSFFLFNLHFFFVFNDESVLLLSANEG